MRSVLLAFALLLLVSPLTAAEPTKPVAPAPAAAAVVDAVVEAVVEPVVPSIHVTDPLACRPNSPRQPDQPAVVEPPKFDMAAADASRGPEVPVGVTVALCVVSALAGSGAGVAVQWKATHSPV